MDLSESLKTLHRKHVSIKVENLKVWTKEEKSWWRRKPTKPEMIILNNVSACFHTGEFVAVIGPSGAGKTTFLVSLAGKCTLPSTGSVTVNAVDVRKVQRGAIEILPQFDVFMDSITVWEHLVFMTEMKLGSTKTSSHCQTLKQLLEELKLKMLQNSPINSLSGGERRLLSLATSLLSRPEILICDEPTTGLDSYNAALVVGVLKQLARGGKTVICSVHQPSSDLFKEFNSVALMAEGRLVFHGTHRECKKLFDSINLSCPNNYNPAEFYIKAVSESGGDRVKALENNSVEPDEQDESGPGARTHRHSRMYTVYIDTLRFTSNLRPYTDTSLYF